MKYFLNFMFQLGSVIAALASAVYLLLFIMTHTVIVERVATGPLTYFWLPLLCIWVIVMVAFFLGRFSRMEDARNIERRVNNDIRGKYEELVTYINLARRITSQDAPAFIDEWLEKRRKKEGLSSQE